MALERLPRARGLDDDPPAPGRELLGDAVDVGADLLAVLNAAVCELVAGLNQEVFAEGDVFRGGVPVERLGVCVVQLEADAERVMGDASRERHHARAEVTSCAEEDAVAGARRGDVERRAVSEVGLVGEGRAVGGVGVGDGARLAPPSEGAGAGHGVGYKRPVG